MLILIIFLLFSILVFKIFKNKCHYRLTILLAILLIAFESLALLDSKYHYGTHTLQLSSTEKIAPLIKVGSDGILLKRHVNEGKEKYNVYVYHNIKNNNKEFLYSKNQHISIDQHMNVMNIKTERQIRKYNNALAKIFFVGITTQNQTISLSKTLELTKENHILTINQLKKFTVNMKKDKLSNN
ncbi:DUF4811 domain-containing protein [Liquorilactobacillus mali]|uniref:DUF4811 domain-containing protein n=1 Tax=Liquorilactobacillus mali KCTC 3596 = DSM 20444 TaxID=1046596 RepID=J1F079_9LACO|nr:DUF4811 domain-containing protein [Liquorilactobacillus mali]EJE97314.1 hypothetical protein LMA_10345 [Liquorilactobacillus mali KCTC 3596 = DSM 20444]KRN11358.1 hypothetical protein FD00_GL000763 [Liquorilactobacillus mali KCTC 3596 = DSM 20444]MDC7953137.1 DUF4811 domain-containing protein [Liquorilactobacillus mali]MDV7757270.1 DUF4811 domain-containing protein [Liquorilactobacillus mali]QFQ75308.1 DUF4811 domain-containing protein [Liquorilactobacillus mali]